MNQYELIKNGIFVGPFFSFPTKTMKIITDKINSGEKLLLATSCNCKTSSSTGVLALTNKRLIYVSKLLFSTEFKDFDLSMITSTSISGSLIYSLTIIGNSDKLIFDTIDKIAAEKIVQLINENKVSQTKTVESENNNSLDDLEKLARLKERGVITNDEFEIKKKQILGL